MSIATSTGFQQRGSLYDANGFATADAVFKEDYLPAIRDVLNSKRILMRYMRRNEQDVYGDKAVILLNTGRSEAMNFIDEGGALPDPQRQYYTRANYRLRFVTARIKVSVEAVQASGSDRGAWINVLDGEMKGIARDAQHEMNRICFGDGSGRLCKVTASGSATVGPTIVPTLPGGFSNNQGKGTQYLRNGMMVALLNASTAGATLSRPILHNGSVETFWVANVDYDAGTFQLSSTNPREEAASIVTLNNQSSGTLTAGDVIYVVKSSTAGDAQGTYSNLKSFSYLKEPYGLAAMVSNTNVFPSATGFEFGGIDASSEPTWRAYQIDNGGTPTAFDQDMLQQMIDGADINGDGELNMFITTHGIRRQYVNQLQAKREYVNKMKLDGGYDAVEFDNRPMVVDKDCTRGRIYGLDQDVCHHFWGTDWHWLDADGSVLHRLPDEAAFQATLMKFCNFGTDARNRNALLADIQDY